MAVSDVQHKADDVKILACLGDDNDVSEYRFLVGGTHTKYVNIEPGVLPPHRHGYEPIILPALPPFPPGDWNEASLSLDKSTGKAVFSDMVRQEFPGVEDVWHETRIDHLQLKRLLRFKADVRIVQCPGFSKPVIFKSSEFPWEMYRVVSETTAYRWLHQHGIGPKFLGHVTEAGRVYGFLIEHIDGHTADVGDLDQCQRALKKLHALNLKHGDINKHNFLIRNDTGEAVLIDFEKTTQCADEGELLKEFEGLPDQLAETTGRGGVEPDVEADSFDYNAAIRILSTLSQPAQNFLDLSGEKFFGVEG